jgi:hypothetical protein
MARILMAWLLWGGLGLAGAGPLPAVLTDPMAPPAALQPVAAGALPDEDEARVSALQLRGARSQALVGGRWVGVGERLPQGVVQSIDERGLRLQAQGQSRLVPLGHALHPPPSPPHRSP